MKRRLKIDQREKKGEGEHVLAIVSDFSIDNRHPLRENIISDDFSDERSHLKANWGGSGAN